ncbi:MAG: hypothetical protein ACI39T_02890, partial [Candidatus Cryptobacteroides sp.]
ALQVPVMRIDVPGEFHEERWHLPLDGDPSSATGKTPCIGHQKDTLLMLPKGDPAQAPPPDGHPSSATEKIPCMAPPGMHSFIEDGINLNTNLVCES